MTLKQQINIVQEQVRIIHAPGTYPNSHDLLDIIAGLSTVCENIIDAIAKGGE